MKVKKKPGSPGFVDGFKQRLYEHLLGAGNKMLPAQEALRGCRNALEITQKDLRLCPDSQDLWDIISGGVDPISLSQFPHL